MAGVNNVGQSGLSYIDQLKALQEQKSRMKPQAEIPETRRLSFFADQAVSTARSVQTRE